MKERRKSLPVIALFLLLFAAFYLGRLCLPAAIYSETERRKLKEFPALTLSAVLSGQFMTDFETYSLDHFPLRDSLRALKSAVQLDVLRQKDVGGLYRAQGHLSRLEYPLDTAALDYAAGRLLNAAGRFSEDARLYLAIVPDKNAFLAAEAGVPRLDYGALEQYMRARLDDMEYIDLDGALTLDDYYRTDPHWRQERLTGVAQRLLTAMGADSAAAYAQETLDEPFYGVYAGQLALPAQPDGLTLLLSPALEACRVYDWENSREIPVYDRERAAGRDPYEVYLSGSLSLVTIENPAQEGGRELILFRDSFGSSLAPLLVDAYAKITLVDLRYISPDVLSRFIDFGDQDVLFLYSTLVLNHSAALK